MVNIGKLEVVHRGHSARLQAEIIVDGSSHLLWFEVAERYAEFLCVERSDAFVLGLLQYAFLYGHDICCETPMTDRLYVQLTEQFMPAFYRANGFVDQKKDLHAGGGYRVRIVAPLAEEVEHPEGGVAVGTGASCGVDSLHVFACHDTITHGCIWNGHALYFGTDAKTKRDQVFDDLVDRAESFTSAVQKNLIIGNTNFDQGCLPGLKFDGMTTFGNLFCIFALQKLWSCYYIASDCAVDNFKFKISMNEDCAHYEFFLFPHLNLRHISIRMDGADRNRIEKIKDLVDYPPAWKYLNVCWNITEGHRNCNYLCGKCIFTLLEIYCLGALDRFRNVFDVEFFKRHLPSYLAMYYLGCIKKTAIYLEMKEYIKQKELPMKIRIKAWRLIGRRVVRKCMRFGRPIKTRETGFEL